MKVCSEMSKEEDEELERIKRRKIEEMMRNVSMEPKKRISL